MSATQGRNEALLHGRGLWLLLLLWTLLYPSALAQRVVPHEPHTTVSKPGSAVEGAGRVKEEVAKRPEPFYPKPVAEYQKNKWLEQRWYEAHLHWTLEAPDRLRWLWSWDRDRFMGSLRMDDLRQVFEYALAEPDSQVGAFLKRENIDTLNPPPDAKTRLLTWLANESLQDAIAGVRSLSHEEKWLLDRYIRNKTSDATINFDTEVKYWEAWIHSRQQRAAAARTELGADTSVTISSDKKLFTPMRDQHEVHYLRAAAVAYIASHPVLARLQSEGWNFDSATPDEFAILLNVLIEPLPGTWPDLVYFIDRSSPEHDAMTEGISRSWRERIQSEPSYLDHDNVWEFFKNRQGRTVILVGHISDDSFVMSMPGRDIPLTLNIVELFRIAQENRVLLIPVGCHSKDAGAPYGFTRPISTDEVANFIAALPTAGITIGDLLAAFARIGPVEVSLSHLSEYMSVVVRGGDTEPNPALVVRVRTGAHQSSAGSGAAGGSASSAYQEFVNDWMRHNRPWHDRGILGWLRRITRNLPGLALFTISAALALMQQLIHWIGVAGFSGPGLAKADITLLRMWLPCAGIWLCYAIWPPLLVLGLLLVVGFLRNLNHGKPYQG